MGNDNNRKIENEIDIDRLGGDRKLKMRYLVEAFKKNKLSYEDTLNKMRIFYNVKLMEDVFKKDVYDFTLEEAFTCLSSLRKSELSTLTVNLNAIQEYMDYAMKKEKSIFALPPFKTIKRKDLKDCLSDVKRELKYLTINELNTYLEKLKNFQDKAIFILMWNGILGQGLKTLANVRIEDLDYENNILRYIDYVFIKNSNGEKEELEISKEIELNDDEMYMLKQAAYESEYKKYFLKKENEEDNYLMADNGYLIKKADGFRMNFINDPVSRSAIMTRFGDSLKALGNSNLKPDSLYTSGVVYRMLQIKPAFEWTQIKDIEKYLSENNIGKNAERIREAIETINAKMEREKSGESVMSML